MFRRMISAAIAFERQMVEIRMLLPGHPTRKQARAARDELINALFRALVEGRKDVSVPASSLSTYLLHARLGFWRR